MSSRTADGRGLSKKSPCTAILRLDGSTASRTSGEWSDDDYDALADGVVGFLYVETSERFSVQHN